MNAPGPTGLRGIVFRGLPSILLIGAVAAAEVALRTVVPPVQPLDVLVAAPDQLLQLVGHQDTEARRRRPRLFEADPLLFWRLKPDAGPMVWNMTLVSTNAQGLRHPRPVEAKAPGTYRIVCLGDSVTFGFRVPLARPDAPPDPGRAAPYPRLLEEALRARNVEVVTMAVPGYSSHQGLAWVRRDLRRFEPDLVVASFGWNDVSAVSRPDVEAMPTGSLRVAARGLVLRSQVALRTMSALRSWRRGAPPPQGIVPPRSSLDSYVGNMRAIAEEVRALSAKVAVLGPVYRDAVTVPDEAARMTAYRRALAAAMHAADVPYLEIAALTEAGYPDNQELFGEHVHPNEEGHRLLARQVAAFLEAERLVPPH